MADFHYRRGLLGLLDHAYMAVDKAFISGRNINDDNGPFINNLWHYASTIRRFPDFFSVLRENGLARILPSMISNYTTRPSSRVTRRFEDQGQSYASFNLNGIDSLDSILDEALSHDKLFVVMGACTKGHVLEKNPDFPRKEKDVITCPNRLEIDCSFVNGKHSEVCEKKRCRVGKVYGMIHDRQDINAVTLLNSCSIFHKDVSLLEGDDSTFYWIELCPASIKRMDMAARMLPNLHGVMVFYSGNQSCHTLKDREIAFNGYRDSIITRFDSDIDPTLDFLKKYVDEKRAREDLLTRTSSPHKTLS